jgi:hypothetical protein
MHQKRENMGCGRTPHQKNNGRPDQYSGKSFMRDRTDCSGKCFEENCLKRIYF